MATAKQVTQDKQTEIFNKYGVFFAFSNEQFSKGIAKIKGEGILLEGEKVRSLFGGGYVPSKHHDTVLNELGQVHEDGRAADIKENGKEKIIERELYNYECFYTGDIEDAIEPLSYYGYTREDILKVYHEKYDEAMKDF